MGAQPQSREARREEARRERMLIERGWYRWEGEWKHPNLAFGWSMEAALRLETEAEKDTAFRELVHGMLKGVY